MRIGIGKAEIFRGRAFNYVAFTLVELLVVIGIIAVLVGILLPALGRARQQAQLVQCQSNLRQIGQAIQIYVGDNNGILPYGYWNGGVPWSEFATPDFTKAADWTTLIQHDLNGSIAAEYNSGTASQKQTLSRVRQVFACPSAPQGNDSDVLSIIYQYDCHPRLMPYLGAQDYVGAHYRNIGINSIHLTPYKIANIKHSSDIAYIYDASLALMASGAWRVGGDSGDPVAIAMCNGWVGYTWNFGGLTDDYSLYVTNSSTNASTSVPMITGYGAGTGTPNTDDGSSTNVLNGFNIRFRHMNNTVMNGLMVDGHVESYTYNAKTQASSLLMKNIAVDWRPPLYPDH